MTITLDSAGKRYNRDWVFRKLTYRFASGNAYALLGPNGSGKSTLLQIIACSQSPSEGSVQFSNDNTTIATEDVFRHITLCAPYMQLIEEFTLAEQLQFHFSFKKAVQQLSVQQIIALLGMEQHAQKEIRYYSSGMKQRVKLCLALLTDASVLLLDEPATNLDEAGILWYRQLVRDYLNERLLIISSNRMEEYEMCGERILLSEYK
ncbi:MAG: ABC transporter ATP-binding protein [Chitinophagales bacterium]|nr:ABC transporter ATP-binding protein [Chitinophagales bacterium]